MSLIGWSITNPELFKQQQKACITQGKVILTVQDHGNTSSASIPMAFDVGVKDGRIQRGQLILMEAFGGGFTWGSVLMRY